MNREIDADKERWEVEAGKLRKLLAKAEAKGTETASRAAELQAQLDTARCVLSSRSNVHRDVHRHMQSSMRAVAGGGWGLTGPKRK